MKSRLTFIVLLIVVIIGLGNYFSTHINFFTDGLFKSYSFETQYAEFQFQTMPSKGRDLKMMGIQFDSFKSENPEVKNLTLYRTFSRNPFKFWNWYDYLTNDNYSYKFKSPRAGTPASF